MVETESVQVVVEVINNTKEDLKQIREDLEKLDQKNVDPDFDLDDEGDIEKIRAQLQALRDNLEADFDIDLDGIAETEAQLQALSRDRTANIDADGDNLFGELAPQRAVDDLVGDHLSRSLSDANLGFLDPDDAGPLTPFGGDDRSFQSVSDAVEGAQEGAQNAASLASQLDGFSVDADPEGIVRDFDIMDSGGVAGDFFEMDLRDTRRQMPNFESMGRNARQGMVGVIQRINDLRPNIMMVYNAIAALIPVIVVLTAAVIGLAAAFGAVAAAGALIGGLGLLGWGKNFSETVSNLQQDLRTLGGDLFDIMQPVARSFQPITEDFIEGIPGAMQQLVDPLQRLTVFSDTLGSLGSGFVDWIAEAINSMASMEGIIDQLTKRFSTIFGNFIIGLLENMVQFTYQNQEGIILLGAALAKLFQILFDVSVVVAMLLTIFNPLIDMFAMAVSLLSNKWVAAALATIATFASLYTVIASVVSILAGMQVAIGAQVASLLGSYVASIQGVVTALWQWVMAANTAYASMARLAALTGVGLFLVGGSLAVGQSVMDSMSGPGPGTGGGRSGGDTYVTVEGDATKRNINRVLDKAETNSVDVVERDEEVTPSG
jgi:hypothetical protein